MKPSLSGTASPDGVPGRVGRIVLLAACLASCGEAPRVVPAAEAIASSPGSDRGMRLRAEFETRTRSKDVVGRWKTFIRMCYAAPESGEVRLPVLMSIVNEAVDSANGWTGADLSSFEKRRDARVATTFEALLRLSDDGGPDQASEALLAAALLLRYTGADPTEVNEVWRTLASRHPRTPAGRTAAQEMWMQEFGKVGALLPDVEWTGERGAKLRVRQLPERTTLYFWCSDCPPCVALIRRYRAEVGDRLGDSLVGVNLDSDRADYADAVTRLSPPGSAVFMGDQPEGSRFRIPSVPAVFVVTAGRVIAVDPSPTEWASLVKQEAR